MQSEPFQNICYQLDIFVKGLLLYFISCWAVLEFKPADQYMFILNYNNIIYLLIICCVVS